MLWSSAASLGIAIVSSIFWFRGVSPAGAAMLVSLLSGAFFIILAGIGLLANRRSG